MEITFVDGAEFPIGFVVHDGQRIATWVFFAWPEMKMGVCYEGRTPEWEIE